MAAGRVCFLFEWERTKSGALAPLYSSFFGFLWMVALETTGLTTGCCPSDNRDCCFCDNRGSEISLLILYSLARFLDGSPGVTTIRLPSRLIARWTLLRSPIPVISDS